MCNHFIACSKTCCHCCLAFAIIDEIFLLRKLYNTTNKKPTENLKFFIPIRRIIYKRSDES